MAVGYLIGNFIELENAQHEFNFMYLIVLISFLYCDIKVLKAFH